jgi:hypothetical protein
MADLKDWLFHYKADGRRIAVDSQLGNVMATLKGTDATDDRVLIISGHLDSKWLMWWIANAQELMTMVQE